jgi:cell wall-associated NlpC family hydrolase
VVAAAEQHLKEPYAWGAAGPDSWDCSGLTSTLWRTVGGVRAIPRVARDQQAWAVPLPAEQVLAGDLVFFGAPVTHVGLVTGRTTTRTSTVVHMVDASSSQHGVVERDVWTSGTVRFGRVPRPGMPPVQPWQPPAPTTTPAPAPAAAPTATPTATPDPSAALGVRAVRLARSYVGSTSLDDVALVQTAWRRAGGAVLLASRSTLPRGAREVALRDARPGDLVAYGPPAAHVGLYAGKGRMVDASRALGMVVVREVWASPGLLVYRLAA